MDLLTQMHGRFQIKQEDNTDFDKATSKNTGFRESILS